MNQSRWRVPDFNDGIVPNHLDLSSSIDSAAANFRNRSIVAKLTLLFTLIVTIVGLIGNLGTILVLNCRTMRKWRSSIVLTALALVDFLYLLIVFLIIIDQVSFQSIGFHRSLLLCQTSVYITHICSFLSASFTLLFTGQRFVAVYFPLNSRRILTKEASIVNIFLFVIVGLSFYSFSFFYTKIIDGQCKEDDTELFLLPLLIVDSCLTFIVPFALILSFNILIVYKLQTRNKFGLNLSTTISHNQTLNFDRKRRAHRDSQGTIDFTPRQLAKLSRVSPSNRNSQDLNISRFSLASDQVTSNLNQQQIISRRTTKMLVICSTMFLVFNSPYSIGLFCSMITQKGLEETLNILRHFYFLSFVGNFFLYSLCGQRFRHEFLLLLKRTFRRSGLNHRLNKLKKKLDRRPTLTPIDEASAINS